jgi:hypothetical protein
VGSTAATATNGVITVPLSCHLNSPCQGAFILCLPATLCEAGSVTEDGGGGRLAGSDFVIPSSSTNNVGVALTTLGKEVASGPGGFSATLIVDLLNYGGVINTTSSETGNFTLTTTDPPTFPPGATVSCGGVVFVNANASCPFAENVVQAFSQASSTGIVVASSPVTGQTYEMQCSGVSPHVCTGGTNALVEFYR